MQITVNSEFRWYWNTVHFKVSYAKLQPHCSCHNLLTHWGRVTHICVSKLNIIGSDNGLSPGRRQVIIWTNTEILFIGPLRTKFNQILIEIDIFSFKKMHLEKLSGKWRPFCLGPNVLTHIQRQSCTCSVTLWLYTGSQFVQYVRNRDKRYVLHLAIPF